MAILRNLDEDHLSGVSHDKPAHLSRAAHSNGDQEAVADDRPNPNVTSGFSAILSCYPVVIQLASLLDLNSLDSLARTCRQFRANLLENRAALIKHTLRCSFEYTPEQPWRLVTSEGRHPVTLCARDLVGECQNCGIVVCRNCTIKPPPTPRLRARHRRLCRTCATAPLELLTAPQKPRSSSSGSASPPPSLSHTSTPARSAPARAFTASAFERLPCCCVDTVYLCQPCGQNLATKDVMYVRAWSWRTRYSHYLGGVGTGAGEGNEGVECGRGQSCLASKIVEHEIECDQETLASLEGSSPDRWKGTSYHAQEIEGVGGGFKMKAKKYVRVGDCVKIYEDEKDRSSSYLEREASGKLRSWCSWCQRVILGEKDRAEASREGRSSSEDSSSSES
ncbi:uncharacterized protein EI97DRAFT_398493 [Westerdykella ornata]|uniref:F-box domain-containing protein n=1 Tax=Westerdykella ornata TaxID=318751 RepID=A0A6A6JJE5_WESOR|nr:uncharacterized protein EI97DRAFT_398493 [Westerdykella ornata]KAF2276582.1 hypothetical protein EI97DRAFT_398493 [Westerdykella ornata]